MVQPQIFHWRSIHEFTPVAVKDIIRAFHAKQPQNESMKCTFNPKTQMFTLEGHREFAEEAFHDLVEVLGDRIGKEDAKRRQKVGETDINIRRVPATLMNARTLQWTENPVDEDEDGFRKDFSSFVALTEDDEAAEFEITKKWLPKQKSTFADCFHRGGKDLTAEVARICGVVIASDWIGHELKIGAHDEESYERAVRKLENIEANFLKPFTAKTAHLFNAEKINRYELRLLPLAKQRSTFLKTTLFPSDSWLGAEVIVTKKTEKTKGINPRLFTVRMAKYDPNADQHVNVTVNMGPVHSAFQSENSRDWVGFTYSEHARIENDNETVVSDETQITNEPAAAQVKPIQPRQSQPPSVMQTDPSTGGLLLGPRPTSIAGESRVTATTNTVESAAPRRVARIPRGAAAVGGSGQQLESATPTQTMTALISTTLSTTGGETTSVSARNGIAMSEAGSSSSSISGRPGGVSLSSARGSRSMASRSELASSELVSSEMATASSVRSEASFDRSDLESMDSYQTNPNFGLGFAAGNSYSLQQQQGFGSQASGTNHRQQAYNNSADPTKSTFGMGFNESTNNSGVGFQLGSRPTGNKGKVEPQTLSDGTRVPVATRRVRSTKTNITTATTSDASVAGSSLAEEPKNVKYIMSGKLALDLIKNEEVKPSKKEQKKPEYETRRYMNTMNQKAPPIRRNKNEEDPQVIAAHKQQVLQAVFGNGLDRARTLKGRVKFEATIGRIVFCDVPRKLTGDHRFTWTKFEEEIMSNERISTHFTDMISSRHWDAEFVADIKFKGSKDMFGAIDTANVTYVFECDGVLDSHFIIEVDAATHEGKVYDRETTLGTVYYHCPMRSWDSKITLTHAKIRDDREESLHALLEALEIPQGKSTPDISFRTNRMDFRISRITVRRELIREFTADCTAESGSQSSPFILATTEIQELRIQRNKFHKGLFRANPYPDMIERNKVWYNFTVRSREVDEALKHNLDLEIGEDAWWTTSKILKYDGGDDEHRGATSGGVNKASGESEILRRLQEVLGNLIKRIDDIGYDNTQVTTYGIDHVNEEAGGETEYMESVMR